MIQQKVVTLLSDTVSFVIIIVIIIICQVKILWDFNIQTDHVIEHRRPDVVVLDKAKNKGSFEGDGQDPKIPKPGQGTS